MYRYGVSVETKMWQFARSKFILRKQAAVFARMIENLE